MSRTLPNESSDTLATPFAESKEVLGGHFCASHPIAFESIFANCIPFENVVLGGEIPPPEILSN